MNLGGVGRKGLLWGALAAWAAAGWGTQALAVVQYGEVSVQVLPDPDKDGIRHGYIEYRVRVTNDSRSREHVVDLWAPANHQKGAGDTISRLSRQVRVAPRTAATVSLFQPCLEISGDGLAVAIDGRRQDQPVPLPRVNLNRRTAWMSHSIADNPVSVLVSRRIPSPSGAADPTTVRVPAQTGAAEWSADWLGYSRFDGVAVTPEDLAEMTSQTQAALRRYVECGGTLVIVGSRTVDDRFRSGPGPAGSDCQYLGFGVVLAVSSIDDTRVKEAVKQTQLPWLQTWTSRQMEEAFPVVEGSSVSVRGLIVLMIVFAVLIGPVNLVVLSRRNRRIWMLWIIPAVSLVACVAVFGYSLISEGWYARVRSDVVTILDESQSRATTIGWTGYYAPLTPGEGLGFDATTEISPEGLDEESYGPGRSGGGSSRSIDLTSGQRLVDGWISARVPTALRVRDNQTRRERLTVRYEPDGTPVVGNALGGAIKELYLADASGLIWRASRVRDTAEVRLSLTTLRASGGEDAIRKIYAGDWLGTMPTAEKAPAILRPGCYMALMEDCPFLTSGLAKVQSRRGSAVVYGIMKRDGHGG